MTTFTELTSAPSHPPVPFTDQLRLAVAAYLARFTGISRDRTESDLRCYLAWCTERGLDPLAARGGQAAGSAWLAPAAAVPLSGSAARPV
jgi:hypothetical protein